MNLRRAAASDVTAITALQHAAYAPNRPLLGVEPLPLLCDYAAILNDYEIWLSEDARGLDGVLVLRPRVDDLLVWSVATAPVAQGRGVGKRLLAAAEARAAELGLNTLRLYTGEPLTGNIAWYERTGYVRESVEQLSDRRLVHMVKRLTGSTKH
ncbi:MAG TPA: GNAT family N-acetyltransferase [Pseudolabrys sp.]|nr:GNAT family N-acetyltransferase [Pseudolabrys sp.]